MYVIHVCCIFSFCTMTISLEFILPFGEYVFSSANTWIYLNLPAICLFWLAFVWFIFLVKLFDLRYVLCRLFCTTFRLCSAVFFFIISRISPILLIPISGKTKTNIAFEPGLQKYIYISHLCPERSISDLRFTRCP